MTHPAPPTTTTTTTTTTTAALTTLPPELHTLITTHLPYPDALALKHTSRHFYTLVPSAGGTSIPSKVSWLLARHERGLPRPEGRSCYFKTDGAFCLGGGGEVKGLMARRRGHRECARRGVEGGCEVFVGRSCGGGEGKGWGFVNGGRWWWWWWWWLDMGRVGGVLGGNAAMWWVMVGLVVAVVVKLWVGLGKGDVLGVIVAGEGGMWSVG